jgi:hypothetical protein
MIRTLRLAAFTLTAAGALGGLVAVPASAQGITTAAIEGRVTDAATGEGLPGATVVAVHEPSGTRYGAATRADGRYDLRGLRVGGPYTVTASFVGYRTETRGDVTLALGQTQAVDFALAEDVAELGEVEVVAEGAGAVIAASRTGAATNVTEEAIEALPTLSRSLADFARLSPLSAGQGSSSIAGRNNRFNNIQVDGATLNDVFGLAGSGTPGGQAGAQPISLDAVEEFNVEIAPYDVRYGGFTGGLLNAVTRSGTNRFTGSLRVQGRSESLVGDLVLDGESVPFGEFSETLYAGTLGGPILRDRLFFFLSGEFTRETFPDNTGVLGSAATNVFPATPEALDEIIGVARGYGYDPGAYDVISDDRASNKLLAKLDWNISPDHRLSLRHNLVDADDDQGISRSTGSFDLSNRRYVFRSVQNSTTAQLNSTLGARATNEARLVYTRIRDQRDVEADPFSEVRLFLDDATSVNMGIERSSQANSLDQDLFEFTDNLTYFAGDHTLLFGTSNQLFRFNNVFIQDFYGSYEFREFSADLDGDGVAETYDAVDAFRLGRPSRYRFSYASEYVFDDQGRLQFACRDGATECTDSQLVPVRTAEPGLRPAAAFDGLQLGLYAQDEWDVTDGLRLTLGLRADLPLFPTEPTENPLLTGTTGAVQEGLTVTDGEGNTVSTFEITPAFTPEAYEAFTGRPYTGEDYADLSNATVPSRNVLFSPRLGFNYQTTGLLGQDLQLRGGTGVFSGRPPYVWLSNQYTNTGADVARVDVQGTFPEGLFPGSADPADQPLPGVTPGLSPVPTTEVNLTAEDFRFPQVWRTNVGLDHGLGLGFTATFEALYSNSLHEVAFRNLNLGQVGTAADGRPLYRRGVNPNFTNVILLDNTGEGYEYSLVAQLQRRVRTGFGGSLSYTYNRAESVTTAANSTAGSNFSQNFAVDPNNAELGTSAFEVRHRVLTYATYRAEYLDRFSTQLGFVLDTQAGAPFSWIYGNDANGDLNNFNDLLYVPADEDDVFLTSDNWDLLDAFIEGEPGLRDFRGRIVERNSGRAPWQTRFDLELNQGITTIRGQRVELEVTLINALNLLNAEWGQQRFVAFNDLPGLTFTRYIEPADVGNVVAGRVVTEDDLGKPVVSFSEGLVENTLTGDRYETSELASRWQLRFGVRYTF